MIADIGIVVGLYVLTRMVELLRSDGPGRIVRVLAVLTVFATLLSLADLVMRGTTGLNLSDFK